MKKESGAASSKLECHLMPTIPDADAGLYPDFVLAGFARKFYKARRERDKRSPVPGLFQDPAWDILLDLFISHTENTSISIKSAGLAANVPMSTALRWVWTLEEAHLIVRKLDNLDKRRSFVSLAPAGVSYMREALSSIVRCL